MSSQNALRLCQRALQIKHRSDAFFTEVKCGSTWGGAPPRIDAVAIAKTWTKVCVTGYEIKITRQDFMRDSKWESYLPFCHRFYFACPKGLIKPEEVHAPAGLIYCSEKGARIVKPTAHKPTEMNWELLYYLVLWREGQRLDSSREYRANFFREWADQKKEFKKLGCYVGDRIKKKIEDLCVRERAVKREEEKIAKHEAQCAQLRFLHEKIFERRAYDFEDMIRGLCEIGKHRSITSIESKLVFYRDKINEIIFLDKQVEETICKP